MTGKNRDHIAISTASCASWNFLVPSAATTYAEHADEITELCKRVFEAFGEFITPITISYEISVYPTDEELSFDGASTEPTKTIRRDLHDESGIDVSDFVTSTRVPDSGSRKLSLIPFDHNRLKVRLKAGDVLADRTDCKQYKRGERQDRKPTWDPLSIEVVHVPNRRYETIETESVVRIGVSLLSDIWVERSEIGERNREYLSAFFGRVADSVSAKKVERNVYRTSDFWVDLGIPNRADSFDPIDIY